MVMTVEGVMFSVLERSAFAMMLATIASHGAHRMDRPASALGRPRTTTESLIMAGV